MAILVSTLSLLYVAKILGIFKHSHINFGSLAGTLLFLLFLPGVSCVCPFCSDTIEGGTNCGVAGVTCPLATGIKHNTALLISGDLTQSFKVAGLLPREMTSLFQKHVLDQIVGMYSAPKDGGSVNLAGGSYSTPRAVVQAYCNGHCSFDEASLELSDRLEAATTTLECDKCSGAIQLLKAKGSDFVHEGVDVLRFIWAKICSKFVASTDIVLRSCETAKRTAVTFVRPKTEGAFYQGITYFIYMCTVLGITTTLAATTFFRDVVFEPINRGLLDWQIAHEYMLLHFRAIAEDTTRKMNIANVFSFGRQDTFLSEARQNAAAFFRTGAGNAQLAVDELAKGVTGLYSGKFDSSASKPCLSFNFGTKHLAKHLDATGCCKFNHICMQWVSDKGPGGMCGGNHPKKNCTYDPAKKLDKKLE